MGIWSHVRYRVLVVVGVIALSLWSLYPPNDTIKRGLDLNGGVQLVLRVDTDGAVRAASERSTERLTPAAIAQIREDTVEQALETIERRVNALGVAEPVVARYTRQDQIFVQLPGVTDAPGAKRVIRSTAQLRLTLVEAGPFASRDAALNAYNNTLPSGLEILPARIGGDPSATQASFYVVRRSPAITGNDLRNARPSLDEFNRPAVAFSLKPEATSRFATFTEQNVGRSMATVVDQRVMSVATIISRIDGEGL